jgi:SHAQKYF class myb-like DNA-binding protein
VHEGKWTDEEHEKFVAGLKLFGKNWNMIRQHVGTRTCPQTRSHAQKFFKKLEKNGDLQAFLAEINDRTTSHDVNALKQIETAKQISGPNILENG